MLLDRTAMNIRNFSAKILKRKCKLNASSRSVQRYMKLLGWRKIKRKFVCECAFVSIKNRFERFIFAKFSRAIDDKFDDSIFIG
jgi:hypothetical protein